MAKANILIVEDDGIVAVDIESSLKKLGYSVSGIVNYGEKAIEKVEELKPDLVLMDIVLKGEMDGIEAADQIRTQSDIPVIFLTAFVDKDRLERAKLTNPFGFILKPFQNKDLEVTIEMALYIAKADAERKQAEGALRESEERFRTAFENAATGIALMTNDGYFMKVNQTLCRILGYSEKELLDKTWVEITSPDDLKGCYDWLKRVNAGEESAFEKRFIHKLGHPVWVMVSSSLVRDSQGRARYYISLFQDIMSRKEAEEALQESEERFKLLAGATIEGLAFHKKGLLLDANDRFVEMFGYDSLTEMLDMKINVTELTSPKTREIVRKNAAEGYPDPYEAEGLRKDGSTFPIIIHGRQIPHEGRMVRIAAVRDITEQKKAESQLQQAHKMESIGTLAGGIAHDFNNILGIILGNTELAVDDVPEWNPARDNLKEIRTACLRAKDIVKQILAFSRKTAHEMKPVRISPIIQESLKLLRASIPTTIEIHQDISSESDTVRADPTQINQVLINLCTNAAHAMNDKGGILEVSLETVKIDEDVVDHYQDLAPGEYVKLTVSDTGPGLESGILGKIFEPYFTTKKTGKGTGMGLAVVHGIVKSHGGDITVNSELGEGTSFQVLLPCIEDEPEPEIEIAAEIPRGNEKILFVDDEKAMTDTMQLILERLGYQVSARTSSIEALEAFRAKPDKFDLVITDYTMPNMTGVDLAKKLMQLRSDIPIILCTGYSEHVNEEKAKEKGISAFVMKPIAMHEIANAIRNVLD